MEMGSRVIREADEVVTGCFSVPGNARPPLQWKVQAFHEANMVHRTQKCRCWLKLCEGCAFIRL